MKHISKITLLTPLFSFFYLLFSLSDVQAQTTPVGQVKLVYSPVPPASGYDTLVKVFCKIDFTDTTSVKRISLKAGTSMSTLNFYNQVLNYKSTTPSLLYNNTSVQSIQKVGLTAYVYIGTFLYKDLYYTLVIQKTDGSNTTPINFTSDNR